MGAYEDALDRKDWVNMTGRWKLKKRKKALPQEPPEESGASPDEDPGKQPA